MVEIIVTDDEIKEVFENCNFGDMDHRKLLEQGVLKTAAKWRTGHTLYQIMKELGLIGKNRDVTKKGGRFIYEAFRDSKNSG